MTKEFKTLVSKIAKVNKLINQTERALANVRNNAEYNDLNERYVDLLRMMSYYTNQLHQVTNVHIQIEAEAGNFGHELTMSEYEEAFDLKD